MASRVFICWEDCNHGKTTLWFKQRSSQAQEGGGRLRKTQLITTFGNGSIVDMPDYSVIMAGANYWKDNSPVLHEPNLEKLLKVSCFKRTLCIQFPG